MAISITVPDLASDVSSFTTAFKSFTVTKQSNGQGGTVAMGTLTMEIRTAGGALYKTASYSAPLGGAATTTLLNFLIANMLPGLKTQEGV